MNKSDNEIICGKEEIYSSDLEELYWYKKKYKFLYKFIEKKKLEKQAQKFVDNLEKIEFIKKY